MRQSKAPTSESRLAYYLAVGCAVVIALLPLHALFTTWAGAAFGSIDVFRVWKELLLGLFGAGFIVLLVRDAALRAQVFRSFIIRATLAYVLYSVLRAVYGYVSGNVNLEATIYGLISNLRYPLFLVLTWTVSLRTQLLQRIWQQLVLLPAAVVVGFGLLQQFVLPKNFLEHVGYGADTIPALHTVDQKPEFMRLQSTLRGPNPLGAYLVLIITVLTAQLTKVRSLQSILFMAASLAVLFLTYSRSAWLGLFLSLVVLALIKLPKLWKPLIAGGLACVLIVTGVVYTQRDNDLVQNVVFHSDETSLSTTSSNEARATALTQNLRDVWQEPLGRGIGSAGPASVRNDQPARIAENYFIQLGQEVGFIGLVLYLMLTLAVAQGLWRRRNDTLAGVLLASLIGITAINMISHAWSDDTLALLWWGLAGVALSVPVILKNKHHGHKTSQKTNAH